MRDTFTVLRLVGGHARLSDTSVVRGFLDQLVTQIRMRKLNDPVVFDVKTRINEIGGEPWEDEGGVTGFVVLSTSHIAVHTFTVKNRAEIHVASCRPYDLKAVVALAEETFRGRAVCVTDLSHSLDWGDAE